jgi:hypothetical protein
MIIRKVIILFSIFLISFFEIIAQSGSYYNSINPDASAFISDLKTRIRNPYTKMSYDSFDETNIANFASKDNGNGTRSVFCVYSNYQHIYTPPFTWLPISREHTYCFSWQPSYSQSSNEYADQHHLFPTEQNNANNIRSNHPLGNVVNVSSTFGEAKFGTDANGKEIYEPRNQHKGDAARALLYMAVRYDGIDGYNWTFNWLNNTKLPSLSEAPQDLATLIAWHMQDPPDKWEIDRNNYIQSIQQNRNPFVDHPEYVNFINFNDLTKQSPVYSVEPQYYPSALYTNSTGNSITLSWTDALPGNQTPSGYLILAYNKDNYFLPIDGEIYTDDTNLSDGFAIIDVPYSAADNYSFNNLTNGNYYFTIYSYNGLGTSTNYKIDGILPRISGAVNTALAVEPTNHATNFTASLITSSSIEIGWTDALPGTQQPEGYLVLANSTNSFVSPVDGTVYSDDNNLADGSAQVYVSYASANTLTFSGLNSNTTYYFKIFSYNGSGGSRNYKTDGNVPQTYGTTNSSIPSLPNAWVNEFHYDNSSTDVNEFIEVVVPNSYTAANELSKFSVVLYNGNGGASYNSKTLDLFTKSIVDTANGFTYFFYNYPTDGIQNGAPDGIALGYNTSLIQFLSYEGTFVGVGGLANGITSLNIGVSENGTASNTSLGLTGSGNKYSDYSWTLFSSPSKGSLNNGQMFSPRNLFITALIEGMYNGNTMVTDTINIELKNAASPYNLLESKKILLNASGSGTVTFEKVTDGTPFYIVLKHRNSIETWSNLAKSFSLGTLSYDFTTSSDKAFGNNMKLVGTKWCIYSGDVNQDGVIDTNDSNLINNDAYNFSSGYLSGDLTGDGLIDINDLVIYDNNAFANIIRLKPD